MVKPNIILEVDLKAADEVAKRLGISNLEYDFLPLASCHVHLKNNYPVEGREVFCPSHISLATHGRGMRNQLLSAIDYLDIKNIKVTRYEIE